MAFDLAFSTQDYDQGKSILIIDDSSDWVNVPTVDSVTFTITSLYDGVVLDEEVIVPIATVLFESGFQYEIKNTDLGLSISDTISDSIYRITMDLYNLGSQVAGSGNTYTSDEIVYYNAKEIRDSFLAEIASYIDDVTNKQIEYANWLDFLIVSIEANAQYGNSSAIYYIFDIFKNISE